MFERFFKRVAATILYAGACLAAASCGTLSRPQTPSAPPLSPPHSDVRSLLDFEKPNPDVTWEALAPSPAATQPTSAPTSAPLARSSVRPNTGLWSLQYRLLPTEPGAIVHHFDKPVDLQNFDTLFASVLQMADPARSGEWTAALYLVDRSGKQVSSDPLPLTTRWQALPLDVKTATAEGLDLGHLTAIGVTFLPIHATEPLLIQTDTWEATRDQHAYTGQRLGPPKSFYVQRQGTRLSVGMVDQYEMTFFQRSGTERPWLTITQNVGTSESPDRQLVLGQPGTGLMLLDQNRYDALSPGVMQTAFDVSTKSPIHPPTAGWPVDPGALSQWSWECTWSSPVAAIVEVKQEVGPYDRLGQPAVALKWRFMIYQWGQVFVHVEWTRNNHATDDPMSWALVLDASAGQRSRGDEVSNAATESATERLLAAIYPASVRQGLTTALPHRMQTGASVAMIGKGAKGRSWWATGEQRRVFGEGIVQQSGPLDCMLLVNAPSPLMEAGSFSQYLVPPKVRVRQGELDRNFPGDLDNDGLVEPYGFQVVRLANGRTSFTIYPQERPLFYPVFLFSVPAVERDALNLKNSRVLINIDGKQFADPPAFPDGSFLLQIPYVLNQPVQVEAILVPK